MSKDDVHAIAATMSWTTPVITVYPPEERSMPAGSHAKRAYNDNEKEKDHA